MNMDVIIDDNRGLGYRFAASRLAVKRPRGGVDRTPRKRTKVDSSSRGPQPPAEASAEESPTEARRARTKEAPDRAIQRFLGRGVENVTRTFLATRAGLKPETPWPELLDALDRFDPELARMLRRVAGVPSKPRPPTKEPVPRSSPEETTQSEE